MPHTFIILVVTALVMAVVLHRSVFGRYLFAVGKNEEAARFSGINAELVIAVGLRHLRRPRPASRRCCIAFYTNSISPGGARQLLRALRDRGGGARRLLPARRRGLDPRHRARHVLLQVLQNLVNLLGIPSSLNFAVMGAVILLGVLADQQLQRRRARQVALAGYKAAKAPVPAGA